VSAKRKGELPPLKKSAQKNAGKSTTKTKSQKVREDPTPYRINSAAGKSNGVVPQNDPLRFIDLFCGIGGFRIAFEKVGGKCVFSSDWDKYSQLTYEANFGEKPHGDIHTIAVADIPKHDVLCGGFPCQPFSIAGVSKKNSLGRLHGFDDAKQGNLFFSIADIIDYHKPKAFILENVKNLKGHDKGRTFDVIYRTLTEALGYTVYTKIIDARSVVPQHRERIFLVGFRERRDFDFPIFPEEGPKLGSILEAKPDPKYTLTDHLWNYLQNYAAKHKAAGNGFGFGLVTGTDTTRTLSARYHKDGSEILIAQKGKNPRRLTPRECARLMGYPDSYKLVVSDTQAYRQFGNSVVVPVVERLAKAVHDTLKRPASEPLDLILHDKKNELPRAVVEPHKHSVKYPSGKRKVRNK
jgi:DNA (cytosine-5)-methyltransferase 1